jgi:hypothetical protein
VLVVNALNANTVTALQNRSGPEFLQPLAILPPRLAEISVSYRFYFRDSLVLNVGAGFSRPWAA